MPQKRAILLIDWDATVSKKGGEETVLSDFFQSLFVGYVPGVIQNFREVPMKPSPVVQQLFAAYFRDAEDDKDKKSFLMGFEEQIFFHSVLQNPNVYAYIVTKNVKAYIEEVFRFQNFSSKEMQRLSIFPQPNPLQGKGAIVPDFLNFPLTQDDAIYIIEDNYLELQSMLTAAQIANKHYLAQVHVRWEVTGGFKWISYLHEINQFTEEPQEAGRGLMAPLPLAQARHFVALEGDFVSISNRPGKLYFQFINKRAMERGLGKLPHLGIREKPRSQNITIDESNEPVIRQTSLDLIIELTLRAQILLQDASDAEKYIIGIMEDIICGFRKMIVGLPNPKSFPEAAAKASTLLSALRVATLQFKENVQSQPLTQARNTLVRSCIVNIDEALAVLDRDLGWGPYLKFIKGAISGLIPASVSENPSPFFPREQARSPSVHRADPEMKRAEELDQQVPPQEEPPEQDPSEDGGYAYG